MLSDHKIVYFLQSKNVTSFMESSINDVRYDMKLV